MGIKGLTFYAQAQRKVLSTTRSLSRSPESPGFNQVVVDGWGSVCRGSYSDNIYLCYREPRFLYALYISAHLDWVHGGEYEDLAQAVISVTRGWMSVGLKPHFVFDGKLLI